jgi:hypothetical protein
MAGMASATRPVRQSVLNALRRQLRISKVAGVPEIGMLYPIPGPAGSSRAFAE